MAKNDNGATPCFHNILRDTPWDAFCSHVFPLMCPDTGRNCHSMCAAYLDDRTQHEHRTCCDLDLAYRTDGYTSGKCLKYGVALQGKSD